MIRRAHQKCYLREGDVAQAGMDCYYLDEITILNDDQVYLGDEVGFGAGCWLNGYGSISIGSGTIIGPRVMIHSANHMQDNDGVHRDVWVGKAVRIDENCWIGMGAIILPGARLLPGTIVGAGAVVSGTVEGTVKGPKAS